MDHLSDYRVIYPLALFMDRSIVATACKRTGNDQKGRYNYGRLIVSPRHTGIAARSAG